MSYDRDDYMRRQDADHAMIRMRDPRYDVRNRMNRDSDGSGEAGETVGLDAQHDSAGPQGHRQASGRAEIAEQGEVFVIRRGGAFFRPDAAGYTNHVEAAGLYSRDEADRYADVEGVTIYRLEDYRAEAERKIAAAQRLLAALTPKPTEQPETVEGVDWSKPIEAFHTDGRVRACKVGQLNAGANTGNDHWLWTADSRRLDSTPGALGSFWVSKDGAVPSYSGWRIRNAASPHRNIAGERTASETDPAELARIQLLADVELHLRSCRIFLTSRQKMHPCGVEIHDEIHARVTAAINDGGARV